MENYKQQRIRSYNRNPLPGLKVTTSRLIAVLKSLKEILFRKTVKYALQFIKESQCSRIPGKISAWQNIH